MAEEPVQRKHLGMVTAPVDLQIRPAGQGRAHTQNQFPRPCYRNRNLFNAQVLLAAKHGG
jgi:hypothetical protein